jgi:hypothetical protein
VESPAGGGLTNRTILVLGLATSWQITPAAVIVELFDLR